MIPVAIASGLSGRINETDAVYCVEDRRRLVGQMR